MAKRQEQKSYGLEGSSAQTLLSTYGCSVKREFLIVKQFEPAMLKVALENPVVLLLVQFANVKLRDHLVPYSPNNAFLKGFLADCSGANLMCVMAGETVIVESEVSDRSLFIFFTLL